MTLQHAWSMRWTLVFSLITGVLISPVFNWSPLLPVYDELRPIVDMRGDLVRREENAVVIHIWGTRARGDCAYMGVQAYGVKNGVRIGANLRRVDAPEVGTTKPPGTYDIGNWRIWPTDNADAVVVFIQHRCDTRVVSTRIAELDI